MKASTIAKLTALPAGQFAMGQGDAAGYIAVHPSIVTVTSLHTTTATRLITVYTNAPSPGSSLKTESNTTSRTGTRNGTTSSLGLLGPRPTAIGTRLQPISTTRFLNPNGTAPPGPSSTASHLSTSTPHPTDPSLHTVQMTSVCGDWGCAYAPVSSASIIATSSPVTTSFQWVCPTCLFNVGQQDSTTTAAESTATRGNMAAYFGTPTGQATRCSFLDRDSNGQMTGTRQRCSTIWAVAEGSHTIFEIASTSTGE
ncbi:hypothetical protein DOTSEDRAFT_38578 [Dothistroma septosporum NZE10]|uniref:Uncharacterized protein n=1 Tax=Dothistroma septosporum (strain NZE10 / CBS 128990) TaxID=675120 RepID=M2Y245_DOTSN|nr:hypothetical protein DOTSEDRAFT_38578 [Dothistroma septosporum NZE10]